MAKEERPLEYERRILDTKGLAQRIDLAYLGRPQALRDWRRRLTLLAPLAAAAAALPLILGPGEKAFSNGPVSRAHAVFESDCQQCHTQAFSSVADAACQRCHDGPLHRANAIGEPRCAACHLEHRGRGVLAEVSDRRCTNCHAELPAHGRNVRLAATRVTEFRPGRHPQFAAANKPDRRPLRLNHAVHLPTQPKTIRGMKLPMQCSDCHATDRASPTGDLLPVTFQMHCRSCHRRELEFDIYQLQGAQAAPAPHTKDPQAIHNFIIETYQKLLAASPGVAQRPLGRDLQPPASAQAWLAAVVEQSEGYLFERKCRYCHEYDRAPGQFPQVKKVNQVRGQYSEAKSEGERWMAGARFSHRAHRAVECVSCHRAAAGSAKTEDVLIPRLEDCRPCHGDTGTFQDRCARCHLYHDKTLELDRDRRPVEELR